MDAAPAVEYGLRGAAKTRSSELKSLLYSSIVIAGSATGNEGRRDDSKTGGKCGWQSTREGRD